MKKILFILCFLGISTTLLTAQRIPKIKRHINPDFNLTKEGIAIQGYDPVAYFTHKKPIKCDTTYTVYYEAAIYCFASEVNKNAFLKSPSRYTPQYGGWCAYSLGESGKKTAVNPEVFKIVDDKLYLFSDGKLDLWDYDKAALKAKADKFWENLMIKP